MKILKYIMVAGLLVFGLASCSKDPVSGGDKVKADAYAIDLYWAEDYSGPVGIQVVQGDTPYMTLAGQHFYAAGINCYELFNLSVSSTMNTASMEAAVNIIAKERVPVVRFSASLYHASQMHYYFDRKDEYFANLKKLAELCDEAGILLIPSIFWQIATMPEYYGEEIAAWGDTESKTYKFMEQYTEEVVNLLKDHKCIAAWEFGNEFNLAADIAIAGWPDIPASSIGRALKGFSDIVKELDPQGRMIASGHAVMRNAQWHLANQKNWNTDSFAQYVEMTGIMTPSPMQGMSEHIYEDPRAFSDFGKLDRRAQVEMAMRAARELGKVFYVGEFRGPSDASADVVKDHYDTYVEKGVQLFLIWNYSYTGRIEHSFKHSTTGGNIAFGYTRDANNKFRKENSSI